MKLTPTHKVQPGRFSMAAMSDIAFLLIIFFMVCAKFVERSEVPVDLPLATTGQQTPEPPTTITINAQGGIFVNEVSMQAEDLLPELRGRLRSAETNDEKTVIIRADRALTYRQIRPAVDAVDRAGGMLEMAVLSD